MQRKHTSTIFGSDEDIKQEVEFKFEYYTVNKYFGKASYVFITDLEIITPISIEATDLQTDLQIRIAEILGEDPRDIRTDCLIEFKIQLKETA